MNNPMLLRRTCAALHQSLRPRIQLSAILRCPPATILSPEYAKVYGGRRYTRGILDPNQRSHAERRYYWPCARWVRANFQRRYDEEAIGFGRRRRSVLSRLQDRKSTRLNSSHLGIS